MAASASPARASSPIPLSLLPAQKKKAEKEISRINKLRANHYKYYTEKDWKEPSNYDICINSDAIGIDNAVNLICDMVKNLIK